VGNLKLAVLNTQPPHLYFGGVERRILETGQRLTDVNITVYSGTKAGFKKPIRVNRLEVFPCFSTDILFPIDNWFFNHTLTNSANYIQADVYEAHNASGYRFIRALRKRQPSTPIVQTVHGVLADEYIQTLKSRTLSTRERAATFMMGQLSKLEGESARNANLVVAVSNYAAARAAQLYDLEKRKIRVVPNGVDPARFKPTADNQNLKKQLGLGNSQIVLFVGRLIPRKGLQFLVNAAKTTVKERNRVLFVIVGNGPLRRDLTSHIIRLDLSENFRFLGDVKESLLPSLYNCADVFVFPSLQEGQGIALLEAQASAKPVVAFNVGGVREAVHEGVTGLLVERGNSDDLAEAILRLLSDATMRLRMGAGGREFVLANYTWDVCAQKMLKVYWEAAGVAPSLSSMPT
jgi:glycosyltransferase involved in cell wall biosynthesis